MMLMIVEIIPVQTRMKEKSGYVCKTQKRSFPLRSEFYIWDRLYYTIHHPGMSERVRFYAVVVYRHGRTIFSVVMMPWSVIVILQ